MAGYADVMNGIVNEATEDVLGKVCGAYMCKVDIKDKIDEPVVITVDGMKYDTKKLLGKTVKAVTYDVAVYSCHEERARNGQHCWQCIGAVPSAFGLLENELELIKTDRDANNMVTMALAAGFESTVGMVIKSMEMMDAVDEEAFRNDILTQGEIMEEIFGGLENDEEYDDGEDEDDY